MAQVLGQRRGRAAGRVGQGHGCRWRQAAVGGGHVADRTGGSSQDVSIGPGVG